MAEPQLEIERRMDRIEAAIREIAKLFGRVEVHNHIEKILRGEKSEESKEDADS
jgi:hypothetical protein